jgi:hypothetical protein
MQSFHGCSLSRNRILRMRNRRGTKDLCFRRSKCLAWKHHVARTDLTLRIDYVGQNGTTCVKLSFIEGRLQVSTVQVPMDVASERKIIHGAITETGAARTDRGRDQAPASAPRVSSLPVPLLRVSSLERVGDVLAFVAVLRLERVRFYVQCSRFNDSTGSREGRSE